MPVPGATEDIPVALIKLLYVLLEVCNGMEASTKDLQASQRNYPVD